MIATLAKTPRVTDAAERLGITPSALSHRIREAERRLGVPLFSRSQKRLRMTAAGEYLAQVAERLIGDLVRAEADAERMVQGVRQVVRLTVEAYSAYHWLPPFLLHLRNVMPDVGLQVVAAASRSPMESLTDHTVDLVIQSGEAGGTQCESLHLFDDELLFIMAPDHKLAGHDHIDGRDIVGEDFITYTRIPEPDREYARLFRPNNTFPNWTETVELPEAIVELVAAGLGTSVLAGWAVQEAMRNGRIVASRVGPAGVMLSWHVTLRRDESANGKVIKAVAMALSRWCRQSSAFQKG